METVTPASVKKKMPPAVLSTSEFVTVNFSVGAYDPPAEMVTGVMAIVCTTPAPAAPQSGLMIVASAIAAALVLA